MTATTTGDGFYVLGGYESGDEQDSSSVYVFKSGSYEERALMPQPNACPSAAAVRDAAG